MTLRAMAIIRSKQDCYWQRRTAGRGFMQATQSVHGLLPEAPTDFVFCILAEEFGFVGALVLLAFYIGDRHLSTRCTWRHDLFGTIIVICVVGMWLFSDTREYRHGLWPYAYYGYSVAVYQLRIIVYGCELRDAGFDKLCLGS